MTDDHQHAPPSRLRMFLLLGLIAIIVIEMWVLEAIWPDTFDSFWARLPVAIVTAAVAGLFIDKVAPRPRA